MQYLVLNNHVYWATIRDLCARFILRTKRIYLKTPCGVFVKKSFQRNTLCTQLVYCSVHFYLLFDQLLNIYTMGTLDFHSGIKQLIKDKIKIILSTYNTLKRNWVFATNSDFLITISLEPNVANLRYFKQWIWLNQMI